MSVRSPFYKIMFGELDLSDKCLRFSYKYSEENNDVCTMELRDSDIDFPDQDYFKERARLVVSWGYITPDGKEQISRIVYVQDIDFTFGPDWIGATITASEKAANMVSGTSKKVYNGTNAFEITKDIADKHGLDAYFIPEEPIQRMDKEVADKLQQLNERALREWADREKRINESISDLNNPKVTQPRSWTDTDAEAYRRNKSFGPGPLPFSVLDNVASNRLKREQIIDEKSELAAKARLQKIRSSYGVALKYLNGVAQVGKSNKQFLKWIFMQEQNGPHVIDTRDDAIVIRKRNFNQVPIRNYTYAGTEGIVKDFSPESKNKSRSALTAVGYGAWSRGAKAFVGGMVDNVNSPVALELAKYMQVANNLREYVSSGKLKPNDPLPNLQPYGLSNPRPAPLLAQTNVRSSSTESTATYIRVNAHITVEKGIRAIDDLINTFTDPSTTAKYFPGYAGDGPGDAYEQARNAQRNAELDRNPGNLVIEGDYGIEVGQIVNIQGVGKRFSGNYYITECEHLIEPGIGYETQMSILRAGHNIPTSMGSLPTESSGKATNTQPSPSNIRPTKKTITTKKN